MTDITQTPQWETALAALAKLYPCMSLARREAAELHSKALISLTAVKV